MAGPSGLSWGGKGLRDPQCCAGPLETWETNKLCPVGQIGTQTEDGLVLYGKETQAQEAPGDGVRTRNLWAVSPRYQQHLGVGRVQDSRHSGRDSSGEVGVGSHGGSTGAIWICF